jgi:arginine decarboxylase
MQISIVSSVGEGKTLLSAFDQALNNAGVSNYNLLVLSSVIPPQSVVKKIKKYTTPAAEFGHKLYVVRAEMRSNEAKKWLAAGVGWYQLEDGRGLFVEHELVGDTRLAVTTDIEELINNSLHDLCDFRGIPFNIDNVQMQTSIAQVKDKPTCVLVIAVYQSEGWK